MKGGGGGGCRRRVVVGVDETTRGLGGKVRRESVCVRARAESH